MTWIGWIGECAGTLDFVGVNYYTRERVRFHPLRPRGGFLESLRLPGEVVSDHEYGEVYSDGLRRVLLETWQRYGRPLYVTENGLPDEDDDLRPSFLYDHLTAVADALDQKVSVRGYYHWSLVDNFEWAEGWRMKFGLFALDPATQRRVERGSARLYAEICRSGTLPEEAALADHTRRPASHVRPGRPAKIAKRAGGRSVQGAAAPEHRPIEE